MKSISNAEFKSILTAAGLDFSIWGYGGILNELLAYADAYGDKMQDKGREAMARRAHEISDVIYNELSRRGYYDKCRDK